MTAPGMRSMDTRAEGRLAQLHPRRFFLETWQRVDAEAALEREARRDPTTGKQAYDWRPLVVLAAGGVFLTLMEYFGNSATFRELAEWFFPRGTSEAASPFWHHVMHSKFARLYGYVWWSGWRVLGYFLLPALTLWCMRERVRDYGLRGRDFGSHAWIYLLCYAVVFVCVVIVSYSKSFSSYYPFYHYAHRSWFDFASWELLYAAQFFSLEFFFRGYWLGACKRVMGSQAIFAMIVPYCMIHYGKPWLEAIAAIVAGVVLGTLAMKTRSIWSGFLIHVSVAITMDVASLLQGRGLPSTWFPGG